MTRPRLLVVGLLTAAAVAMPDPGLASHEDGTFAPACETGHVPSSGFTDVTGNAHEAAVDCAHWYGVAAGTSPSQYGPAALVRRDQMASLLARALTAVRVTLPEGAGRFTDVEGNTHAENIERLAAAGIIAGTGPHSFSPARFVTRGQLASLLWRAHAYASTTSEPERADHDYFEDDDGTTHEDRINLSFERARLVSGTAEPVVTEDRTVPRRGRFHPEGLVRRDQAASFVAKLLRAGVLHWPGSTDRPYPRGTQVALRDGWVMTVVGSDNDATAEVLAEDPRNTPPATDHRFVLVRLRATNAGPETSAFDGPARLAARRPVVGSNPDGSPGFVYPAVGRPCGDIPDELSNEPVATGASIEGNVCFEVPDDEFSGAPEPDVVDLHWGNPALPHFSRYAAGDQAEVSPYA